MNEPIREMPADKIQAAIAQCRQDPALRAYYDRAPAGARMYAALQFFCTLFGDEYTEAEREQYEREVEEELTLDDLVYLANHDPDKDSKAYVRSLLDERMAARRRAAPKKPAKPAPPPPPPPKAMTLKTVEEVKREMNPSPAPAAVDERVLRLEAEVRAERADARRDAVLKAAVAVCAMALVGVGAFVAWRTWTDLHNEKLAAAEMALRRREAAEAERAAAEAERKAAEAKAAAERVEREAAAKSSPAEAEPTNAVADAEAERVEKENAAKFEAVLAPFVGAHVDYWRNAPKSERPETAAEPKNYVALVPADGGFMLIEMSKSPGAAMTYREVAKDGTGADVSAEDFRAAVAGVPYFVLSGRRAYFCSAKKKTQTYAVPKKGEALDPGREEFGALADVVAERRMDVAKFRYKVSFQPDDELERAVAIGVFEFGKPIPRAEFFEKLKKNLVSRMAQRAGAKAQRRREAARKKVYRRTVGWGAGSRLKKRLDGGIEVPRNCPVEYWDTRRRGGPPPGTLGGHTIYRSDNWRKAANRYEEWRALCDEAWRQESEAAAFASRAAAEANAPVTRREVTASDVDDALDAGEVVVEPAE